VEKNRTLETSKMFIAMNRFKVIKEERKSFEDLWVTRESHLDEVKGFRAFHWPCHVGGGLAVTDL
jgi:hypothetical protein